MHILLAIATMLIPVLFTTAMLLVMIPQFIMYKAAGKCGEVYRFNVVLLLVVRLLFALGFVYALVVLDVVVVYLGLRFIGASRTKVRTSIVARS